VTGSVAAIEGADGDVLVCVHLIAYGAGRADLPGGDADVTSGLP